MPITLYRIDDRLVHGQVVEAWVPYLKAGEIAVVSDDLSRDLMRQTIMRFAAPEDIALRILPLSEAPAYLSAARISSFCCRGLPRRLSLLKKA